MEVEIRVEIVALADEAVWLIRSPQGEWTLPGGPLMAGEDPVEGVRRWMRRLAAAEPEEPVILEAASSQEGGRWRLILRYACRLLQAPRPAPELPDAGLFQIEHLPPLDAGQRAAIYRALQAL